MFSLALFLLKVDTDALYDYLLVSSIEIVFWSSEVYDYPLIILKTPELDEGIPDGASRTTLNIIPLLPGLLGIYGFSIP